MACKACIRPCERFVVSRQAITPARWCGLMTVGMMADRSSVIGLTREYRANWSFSMILCTDVYRPQWVRIAKVALHYTEPDERPDAIHQVWRSGRVTVVRFFQLPGPLQHTLKPFQPRLPYSLMLQRERY